MSKRQKQRRAPSEAHDDDKPQYAADYMTPKQKPKKKAEKIEDTVHVQEHLQNDVLGKLKDLKQKLTAEEESVNSDDIKVSKQGDRSRGRSTVNKRASASEARKARTSVPSEQVSKQDKREKSFAELFDPVEEDEASFDDLLKESKLDWRKFK